MAGNVVDICERTYAFALKVMDVVEQVQVSRSGNVVAKQLARAGTSVGANVEESRTAESTPDFIHKLSICLKEARETRYWLRIVRDKGMVSDGLVRPVIDESEQLANILASSIITAKRRNH